jgi:hypothetical protein
MKQIFRKKPCEERIDAPRNEYYEEISARLGILQVVLYLGIFAFVVLSFLKNTELITYRNFYYFFKDLNASAETVDVFAGDAVSYPTADEQSFALYRQGLAVAGNESVTVFTATGRQTVSKTIQYRNPIAEGAGRYLLVYEMGGTQYSLYNSYTQIYVGTSAFPIYGAAVSDSGMYALISRSEEYNAVIELYNSNFRLINRYNKNGYVTDVAINENGSLLAIPSTTAENGRLQTQVSLYEPYKTSGTTLTVGQSLPLECAFSTRDRLLLLCSDGVSVVSSKGELLKAHSFDGQRVVGASITIDGATVALKSQKANAETELLVLDANGDAVGRWQTLSMPLSVDRVGNVVFYKTQNGIVRLDTKSGDHWMYECNTEHRTLLAVNESEVLLCSPQKADYIRLS